MTQVQISQVGRRFEDIRFREVVDLVVRKIQRLYRRQVSNHICRKRKKERKEERKKNGNIELQSPLSHYPRSQAPAITVKRTLTSMNLVNVVMTYVQT